MIASPKSSYSLGCSSENLGRHSASSKIISADALGLKMKCYVILISKTLSSEISHRTK